MYLCMVYRWVYICLFPSLSFHARVHGRGRRPSPTTSGKLRHTLRSPSSRPRTHHAAPLSWLLHLLRGPLPMTVFSTQQCVSLFKILFLSVFICMIVCYVCQIVCVCVWLHVLAISDSFVRSELDNGRFLLCLLWTRYTGDSKIDPWDD